MAREYLVISDTHLGGKPGSGPRERGFQMMTNPGALAAFLTHAASATTADVIINGDLVDFLAEEHLSGDRWRAFTSNAEEAVAVFESIAERYSEVFVALGLLAGRLTLLLGNHDLELSLPDVRRAFQRSTNLGESEYRFLFDNEALQVGTAIIEHGNRYDPANTVDYDGLRRVRSLHSRKMFVEAEDAGFTPPPGSQLVAQVMNDIKVDFPFIDLLKPESEPLLAMVLALDPSRRSELVRLAWTLRGVPGRAAGRLLGRSAAMPVFRAEISSSNDESALELLLSAALRPEARPVFVEREGPTEIGAAGARALLEGLLRGKSWGWEQKVARIQAAVQALRDDQTFSTEVETGRRYLAAAEALSAGGRRFSHVIFGHTHHAKDLALGSGGRYLNSGAWADVMRFPTGIMDSNTEQARLALTEFLVDCGLGNESAYVEFLPGCVQILVGNQTEARYRAYDPATDQML